MGYLRTSDNEKEVQRKRKELFNAFSEKRLKNFQQARKLELRRNCLNLKKTPGQCEHFKRNGRKVVNGLTILEEGEESAVHLLRDA